MYETLTALAASLTPAQSVMGVLASAAAVKLLGYLTQRKTTGWTGLLNLVYLGAILVLLFFTHAVGINFKPV